MCEFWILTDLVILVDLAILVKLAIMLTLVIFVKLVNCCCCWVAFVNGHVAVILSNCRGPAALERGLGENLKKLPSGLVAHHSCNSSCRSKQKHTIWMPCLNIINSQHHRRDGFSGAFNFSEEAAVKWKWKYENIQNAHSSFNNKMWT